MAARLDELFKAAGEPTRLRILNLLRQGSICVCDLQAVLGIPQPTISRHLAALRHAGLVSDQRNGTRVIYTLAPATNQQFQAFYQLLGRCCPQEGRLQDDSRRLKHLLRAGECTLIRRTRQQGGTTR